MEGISKERLTELLSKLERKISDQSQIEYKLLDSLIEYECKELDLWLLIDENTPNDRPILLFYPESNNQNEFKRVDFYNGKSELCVNPTHYKELPKDPI